MSGSPPGMAPPAPPAFPHPVAVPVPPGGEPAQVRGLAAACRALAGAVDDAARRGGGTLDGLAAGWRGEGSRAATTARRAVAADAALTARGLREAADRLDHYADHLAAAQHRHHWSIGRLVAVGAVVAAGAAVVVVTAGAAAPAGSVAAAEVAEAIAAAEGAAAAAGAAEAVAARALLDCRALFAGLRPLVAALAPRLAPHLAQGLTAAGLDAAATAAAGRGPRAGDAWRAFALGAATSAAAGGALAAAGSAANRAGLPPGARLAAGAGAVGGVQAAAEGAAELAEHRGPDPWALLAAGAGGVTFHALPAVPAPWVLPAAPGVRPPAGPPRGQTLDEILTGGVALHRHEAGRHGGHTLARHVSRRSGWLLARTRRDRLALASSFFGLGAAEHAVDELLRRHAGQVRAFLAGELTEPALYLRHTAARPPGYVQYADGRRELSTAVCLKAVRRGDRLLIVTAYLDRANPRPDKECFHRWLFRR